MSAVCVHGPCRNPVSDTSSFPWCALDVYRVSRTTRLRYLQATTVAEYDAVLVQASVEIARKPQGVNDASKIRVGDSR